MSEFYNAEYLSERLAAVCQERDELRQIVAKQADMNRRVTELALELDTVKAERDALKAADAVPVVRCKDCKHFYREQCYHTRHDHHTQAIKQMLDDFCSYGERKDGEG